MRSDARFYRDRHGRGMRGPISRVYRKVQRDELWHCLEGVLAELDVRLEQSMKAVSVAIEDTPSAEHLAIAHTRLPLGRAQRGNPSVVVIYRRPIQEISDSPAAMARIVRDTMAELVGSVVGLRPYEVLLDYQR